MKWAPHGNATHTYFKLQGEWLQSRRDGNPHIQTDPRNIALVATPTSTRSPPSSCASAPHSGSQASTLTAACAGSANVTARASAASVASGEVWGGKSWSFLEVGL